MKNNVLRFALVGLLSAPMLWGCQRESLLEDAKDTPMIHAAGTEQVCDGPFTAALADQNGNTVINFCSDGDFFSPTQVPCGPNPGNWGSVTYQKVTSGSPNSDLVLDVQLNVSWMAIGYDYALPFTGPVQTQSGLPTLLPTNVVLQPERNSFQIVQPLSPGDYGASCYDWALDVQVAQLSLFAGYVAGSQRTLYAYDATGSGSPFVIDRCYASCEPPVNVVTTATDGNCHGCRAQVTATFTGCSQVDINSCQSIRQVVVVYSDCSREYHDNTSGTSLSYTAPTGKSISHVFVRSGCRANAGNASLDQVDTNGFTYHNVRRFQLNGNCLTASCN